jgi:RNA 2',3'-cyclic 3'-phosphodiesterase
MNESSSVRAFVAVDLAPDVHAALARLKAELARVRSDVRWVRDDGLHATLKFLGGVPRPRLDDVRDAVTRALATIVAFPMRAHGLGAFPSMSRPRVVWAGLEGYELAALAQAIENALMPLGFSADGRAFHPHVTLGRVSGRRGWSAVEDILKVHWTDEFGVTLVDHVSTYRSDLRPGGAVYTKLWTTGLADSTKGVAHGPG